MDLPSIKKGLLKMYVRQWHFAHKLGVSVVSHADSEGGALGLFEVAILMKSPNGEGYSQYLNLGNCCFEAVGRILHDVADVDALWFSDEDLARPAMRILKCNEKYWKKIHRNSLKNKDQQYCNECVVPIDR